MKHDVAKYLADVLLSVELINKYLNGVESLAEYESDEKLKDAITRRLSIIGEALFQANKQDNLLPISHKDRIIRLRHILVHDYDSINDELIWSILRTNFGRLKDEVEDILKNL